MATMTLAEAEAQLVTVNAAIEQLVQGKRINELRVGSGSFQRFYRYEQITLDELLRYRDELLGIIQALTPIPEEPVFRINTHIPLVVHKERY